MVINMRFQKDPNKLQIIIPKQKNRGFPEIANLLERCEIKFKPETEGFVNTSNERFEIGFFPPRSIPKLVENEFPLGICGLDMVREERAQVLELLPLGISKTQVVLAKRKGDKRTLEAILKSPTLTIATALPNITKDYLNNPAAIIDTYPGALESILLNNSKYDAIVDQRDTGKTLAVAGLISIATLLESEYYLIANTTAYQEYKQDIKKLVALIESRMNAADKYLLTFNVPSEACAGIERLIQSGKIPYGDWPTPAELKNGMNYWILVDASQLMDVQYLLTKYGATYIVGVNASTFVEGIPKKTKSFADMYNLVTEKIKKGVGAGNTMQLLSDKPYFVSKLKEEIQELWGAVSCKEGMYRVKSELSDVLYLAIVAAAKYNVPLESIKTELNRKILVVQCEGTNPFMGVDTLLELSSELEKDPSGKIAFAFLKELNEFAWVNGINLADVTV